MGGLFRRFGFLFSFCRLWWSVLCSVPSSARTRLEGSLKSCGGSLEKGGGVGFPGRRDLPSRGSGPRYLRRGMSREMGGYREVFSFDFGVFFVA